MKNYSVIYFDQNGNIVLTCQLQGADFTRPTIDGGVSGSWPGAAAQALAILGPDSVANTVEYTSKP